MNNQISQRPGGHDPQRNLQAELEAANPHVIDVSANTSNRLPGTATSRIAARRRQARRKNQALKTIVGVVFGGLFLIATIALLVAYAAGGFLYTLDAPAEVESGFAALIAAEIAIYGTVAVVGLMGFGIWLYALVDLAGGTFDDSNQKLVWVLIVVLCGTVGAIIYLIMGDEQTRSSARARRN